MTAALILCGIVILIGSIVMWRHRPNDVTGMTAREAADRLRPRSGAVEVSPQRPPIEGER